MDSNYKPYDHLDSFRRIDAILNAPAGAYEETDSLPDRDRLTFTNGFYSYSAALFVDIRDSSKLPDAYTRPVLAKIYRSFISEMVAILNSDPYVREVNIVGDCVWAVYKVLTTTHIDDVFSLAAKANSLTMVLNYKMKKKDWTTPLRFGIGISYGRALMIKAGFNGSGINDVVYMGDVVNKASKLAGLGSSNWQTEAIVVDQVFYQNLNEKNRGLLRSAYGFDGLYYHGDVVNAVMNDWYETNCT
jgi:class 3 adenylate cyclase